MLAREIYARPGDLCSPGRFMLAREIYARPGRFMLAPGDLCSLRKIYERFSGFTSGFQNLRALFKIYERFISFTAFNEIYVLLGTTPPKSSLLIFTIFPQNKGK
jgi:hypothetical protein